MTPTERDLGAELERIRDHYRQRDQQVPSDYYSILRPANLFAHQGRERGLISLLRKEKIFDVEKKSVLDVGCGDGNWLIDFVQMGFSLSNMAGIDLMPERIDAAKEKMGAFGQDARPDFRCGDATILPWEDQSFDFVLQSTLMSSILDANVRQAIALEMTRVLRPDGCIIWYDFLINPKNKQTRGINMREIKSLFPGFGITAKRIILAPPLARTIVPLSELVALALEKLRIVNSHHLALLRKP